MRRKTKLQIKAMLTRMIRKMNPAETGDDSKKDETGDVKDDTSDKEESDGGKGDASEKEESVSEEE